MFIVVTCEHGGNRIPRRMPVSFAGGSASCATHRGYDPGALVMARELAAALARAARGLDGEPPADRPQSVALESATSWSDATRALPPAERAAHRSASLRAVPAARRATSWPRRCAAGRRVIHLSSHSFTPVLDGDVRNADVGLLYDPARAPEAALAARWKTAFADACAGVARAPELSVRRKERRPDVVAAPALSGQALCRGGNRDQSGVGAWPRGPVVATVARTPSSPRCEAAAAIDNASAVPPH